MHERAQVAKPIWLSSMGMLTQEGEFAKQDEDFHCYQTLSLDWGDVRVLPRNQPDPSIAIILLMSSMDKYYDIFSHDHGQVLSTECDRKYKIN